jgi:rhomboid protease GluP
MRMDVEIPWLSARAPAKARFGPPAVYGGRPQLYFALLAVLVVVFACELAFPATPANGDVPSVGTLALLGATTGVRVFGHNEWWRLFTAPFLHGSAWHLATNVIVLVITCRWLERLVGWRWTLAIYCVSGVAGAWFSVIAHPPKVVGVGASGAILGLLGALYVVSFRLGPDRMRGKIRRTFYIVAVPAIVPVAARGATGVDYAAHVAGAVVGSLLAVMALWIWDHDEREPRHGFYAAIAGAACFVAAIVGVGQIVDLRALYLLR